MAGFKDVLQKLSFTCLTCHGHSCLRKAACSQGNQLWQGPEHLSVSSPGEVCASSRWISLGKPLLAMTWMSPRELPHFSALLC